MILLLILCHGNAIICSCEYSNDAYQINTHYTTFTGEDFFVSIYPSNVVETSYCNSKSLLYSLLPRASSNKQIPFSEASTEGSYLCVMHAGVDCGPSQAKQIFSCPKPPAKSSSSMSSIFTIFLPSLIFFIFFLAIIIHLLRRNAYNNSQQLSQDPDPTQNILDRSNIMISSASSPSEALEMTNVAAPIYTIMTNVNGQTVLVPNFAPPQQFYTNNGGMPSVVYVSDPTNVPPIYVATSPLPPQY